MAFIPDEFTVAFDYWITQLETRRDVFLANDDDLAEGSSHEAAPRDNVVFEAGFFAAATGRNRVLTIRKEDDKLPADLGGSIRPVRRSLRHCEDWRRPRQIP